MVRPADPSKRPQREHYTPGEAYEARELFMRGWPLRRVARHIRVPHAIAYKWCVLGRHHPDAKPSGFDEFRDRYTRPALSATERIDQLPRAIVREFRELLMTGQCYLADIQMRLNELDLAVPLTGLESDDWAQSDLVRLLFGLAGRNRPYPAALASMPSGYARWHRRHARNKVDELRDIQSALAGRRISLENAELLVPILGRSLDSEAADEPGYRPMGFVGELSLVSGFTKLEGDPLRCGVIRRDFDSAVGVAHALIKARANQRAALKEFVVWGEGIGQDDTAKPALQQDVADLAECCGLTVAEATRIYRFVQEQRFLKGAGCSAEALVELDRMRAIFIQTGTVAVPDTSFSRSEEWFYSEDLMMGRVASRARVARCRGRRRAIRGFAKSKKSGRPE